jgi:hypothetical protein
MHEAEVADNIDTPEVLVACSGLHDLLGHWQLDQRCVLQLGVNRYDVLRVVFHRARRDFLHRRAEQEERQGEPSDKNQFAIHAAAPFMVVEITVIVRD